MTFNTKSINNKPQLVSSVHTERKNMFNPDIIDDPVVKIPRKLQRDVIDKSKPKKHFLLNACPGAGKTITAQMLFTHINNLNKKPRKSLYITPMLNICAQYADYNEFDIGKGVQVHTIPNDNNFGDKDSNKADKAII